MNLKSYSFWGKQIYFTTDWPMMEIWRSILEDPIVFSFLSLVDLVTVLVLASTSYVFFPQAEKKDDETLSSNWR